jgi:hypothetical protein
MPSEWSWDYDGFLNDDGDVPFRARLFRVGDMDARSRGDE